MGEGEVRSIRYRTTSEASCARETYLGFLATTQLSKDHANRLPLSVSDRSEPVPGCTTHDGTCVIRG